MITHLIIYFLFSIVTLTSGNVEKLDADLEWESFKVSKQIESPPNFTLNIENNFRLNLINFIHLLTKKYFEKLFSKII